MRGATTRLSVLLATVALLAGCVRGGGSGERRPSDEPIDSFTYGVQAIPPTLDVANNYNSDDMPLMGLVTQPLEVPKLDGTFKPVLAESVRQPDDRTLVYDLRRGVRFSDGTPMTSADVLWTIHHLRGASTQTASELTNLASVRATGTYRVTIALKRPNPAQRGALAMISFIQQRAYGKSSGKDLGTPAAPPVGTGPYVVDSYDSGGIAMSRNDRYWAEPPAVDAFDVTRVADDTAGQLAMRSGELDGIVVTDVKTTEAWENVQGAATYESPTMFLDYLTMDTESPPFDDIHVRRAIAYATDVDGLVRVNYGEHGRPPVGLTPGEVLGPVEPRPGAFASFAESLPAYPYDLQKAKAELAKSEHPDGFTTTYEYYTPGSKLVGISLQENLSKIGIDLELKSRRLNDYIGDLFVGNGPEFGFFSLGALVPDPSSWYLYMLAKGNPYNASHLTTEQTEHALEQIDTGGPDERWQGVRTLVDTMAEKVPYVGLAQPNLVFAVADGAMFTKTPDFLRLSSGDWVNYLKATR